MDDRKVAAIADRVAVECETLMELASNVRPVEHVYEGQELECGPLGSLGDISELFTDDGKMAGELMQLAEELTAGADDLDQHQVIIGQTYTKLDRALKDLVADETDVQAHGLAEKYVKQLETALGKLKKKIRW